MDHVIAVVLIAVGSALSVATALSARVLFELISRGPIVADEAFEGGHSLRVWWCGSGGVMSADNVMKTGPYAVRRRGAGRVGVYVASNGIDGNNVGLRHPLCGARK